MLKIIKNKIRKSIYNTRSGINEKIKLSKNLYFKPDSMSWALFVCGVLQDAGCQQKPALVTIRFLVAIYRSSVYVLETRCDDRCCEFHLCVVDIVGGNCGKLILRCHDL